MASTLSGIGRRTLLALVFIGCGGLSACRLGAHGIVVDPLRAERSRTEIVERFQALRSRVFSVGYALRAGGRRLCGSVLVSDPGLLLSTPEDLEQSVPLETDRTEHRPRGLSILHVVPGSALARAGVQPGDRLLELAGTSPNNVAQLNERLVSIDERDAVSIRLLRGTRPYGIELQIPRVCAIPVNFSEDPGLMTFQRGHSVAVPFGLLEAVDDTRLAIAIAHQIAHVLLDFATETVPDPEATTDRLGLLLAAEAGFDVREAPAFWEWLATENPWRISPTEAFRVQRPHPFLPSGDIKYRADQLHLGIAARLPAIRASVDEILQAQAQAQAQH